MFVSYLIDSCVPEYTFVACQGDLCHPPRHKPSKHNGCLILPRLDGRKSSRYITFCLILGLVAVEYNHSIRSPARTLAPWCLCTPVNGAPYRGDTRRQTGGTTTIHSIGEHPQVDWRKYLYSLYRGDTQRDQRKYPYVSCIGDTRRQTGENTTIHHIGGIPTDRPEEISLFIL